MSGHKPAYGDLILPYIFVPEGESLPPEWHQAHPDWIALPAVFIPEPAEREEGRDPTETPIPSP